MKKEVKVKKKHLHWVKITFIWLIFGCVIITRVVVILHLIFPESCRWLPKDEIMNLKSMLVSGIGGAILTKFGNKIVQ